MKTITFTFLILCNAIMMLAQSPVVEDNPLAYTTEQLKKLANVETGIYTNSVADFISLPTQSDFQLSPNGDFLAYLEKDSLQNRFLVVRNIQTQDTTIVLKEGEDEILNYLWKDNHRLLYFSDKGSNELFQLFGVDKDGHHFKALTPYDSVQVNLLEELPQEKDHIIISMNKDNPSLFEPYKINIRTGALKKLFNNTIENGLVSDYYFSEDGELQAYDVLEIFSEYALYYNTSAKDETPNYQEVVRFGLNDWFQILGFIKDEKHPHRAYVLSNLDSDTKEIILYDLGTKKVIQKLFQHPTYDLADMSFSDNEIDYYYYYGIKKEIIPISKKYKKIHARFTAYFGDNIYSIENISDDKTKYLVHVSSPKLYGKYYLYQATNDTFQDLVHLKPQLKEEDMAEMHAFHFTSRDSVKIEAYFIKPNNIPTGQKTPLLVIPHGGPYDLRDYWEFVDYAQLFASRGYGVLQINFRGSFGYGKKFSALGYKQVGRNMLHDLEDGLAAILKQEDWINPDKVGLFGTSYGGLAVLQSLIKRPEAYACGIDIFGPTNIFTLFEAFPPYWEKYIAWFYSVWYNPNNAEEAEIIKDISPFFHLDKINKPLFVAHGANDPRVSIQESDRLVKGLRERGREIPYMVKYNEGHRWSHDENLIDLFEVSLGFYAKYLK